MQRQPRGGTHADVYLRARRYWSLSFLHEAAECVASLEVPTYLHHLGDFDPSGQDAAHAIEQTMGDMAPEAEIYFERIPVTPEQIARWRLPTRPTNGADANDALIRGLGLKP